MVDRFLWRCSMSTLLVIDDEPAILESIRMALDGPDATVVTAASAAEGLEKLAQCQPDVVMLDINLPDMSGLEVFRRIREQDPRIPAIFITGEGTTGTAIEAMSLGAYEHLLKPFRYYHVRWVGWC